ncbi:uncharacterized protein LOC144448579 [Glandiceps talaboti]
MSSSAVQCIIKLGGSAITKKDSFETIDAEAIKHAAKIVEEVRGRCIVVHGAGSFGHFQAKEYGVSHGFCGNKDAETVQHVKTGFLKTRISVTKLNHIVTSEFVNQGILAVSLSPCGRWKTDNRHVIDSGIEEVKSLLEHGFIPIMHGDCVIDKSLGSTILSGDTIIEKLCDKLNPKRVVFLTDVDGIHDRPPSEVDAKLLHQIYVNQDGQITVPIATSFSQHDVTGGIAFKLKTAVAIVTRSKGRTPVFICKIDSKSGHGACCDGNILNDAGTQIIYKYAH